MRQDQRVSDLASLGIQGCQDFGSGALQGSFTRTMDLGIRRWRIGARTMKTYWEEDEFRYWEFTHMKASDAAGCDKAFALGFWICRGRISDAQSNSAAYSTLEKAFVPCFENTAFGARGAACKPKGSVCAEAENFSAHAYVYKN